MNPVAMYNSEITIVQPPDSGRKDLVVVRVES